MIHLISWNIAVRSKMSQQQIEALMQRTPDIVALQEVSVKAKDDLISGFEQMGLIHIEDTVNEGIFHKRLHYNELIASRWPLSKFSKDQRIAVPFPESVLSATIDSPFGKIDIHTTHIPPGSSNGWIKIETLEKIYQKLATTSSKHRILCGDFNTPQIEKLNGSILTWGQREKKNGEIGFKKSRGKRWDIGERNILQGLAQFDLKDVFRLMHGYHRQEFSWYTRSKNGSIGRRFDHVFASSSLCPKECCYIHTWREEKLSDHSAIEAIFDPDIPQKNHERSEPSR
ncbi:MAG: endonuclease/exonuclease/phosphatase family protein [Desulfamplus sp.]|nr:endonuclease/exonuclease/phosphatase family protein [Desulfamplus sp.]